MKTYSLYGARLESESGIPIIVIRIPWTEFCHPLGCDEYAKVISRTRNMPIIVSLSPEGEWKAGGAFASQWKHIISKMKAEELKWHSIQVADSENPSQNVLSWISLGFMT